MIYSRRHKVFNRFFFIVNPIDGLVYDKGHLELDSSQQILTLKLFSFGERSKSGRDDFKRLFFRISDVVCEAGYSLR